VKGFLRGYFPDGWTYEQRIAWYKQNTEDHTFLFIDNLAGTIYRCRLQKDQLR
jgi:hypothetical protein